MHRFDPRVHNRSYHPISTGAIGGFALIVAILIGFPPQATASGLPFEALSAATQRVATGAVNPITLNANNDLAPDIAHNSVRDEYLVVWADDDATSIRGAILSSDGSIRVQPFTIAGPVDPSIADYKTPAAAYKSGTNQYIVVFILGLDSDTALDQVNGNLLDQDGNEVGFFGATTGLGDRSYPDVVADPFGGSSGRYLVTWIEKDGSGINQSKAQLLGATGNRLFALINLPPWSNGPGAQRVALAYNATSDIFIHAEAGTNATLGNANIYSATIDISGNQSSQTAHVPGSTFDGGVVDVAYDSNSNQDLIVWTDTRNGPGSVYGQRLSGNGAASGGNFEIDNGSTGFSGANFHPSVAGGSSTSVSNSAFLVTYQRASSSVSADIYGTIVRSDGSITGGAQKIFAGAGANFVPALAHRGGGDFLVTWERSAFTLFPFEDDIFVRRFRMAASSESPSMNLAMDKTTYSSSDTFSLIITYTGGTGTTMADVYLVLQLPDGKFFFSPSWTETVEKHRSNTVVVDEVDSLLVHDASIATVPAGTYTWYWALTQPGTLNTIGGVQSFSFTKTPF